MYNKMYMDHDLKLISYNTKSNTTISTIQSQILDLIKDLQDELAMAVMFITHDMGVIAEMADRVVVMFGGEIMEEGPVEQIFHDPQHEYTQRLIAAVPRIGSMKGKGAPERFPLVGA